MLWQITYEDKNAYPDTVLDTEQLLLLQISDNRLKGLINEGILWLGCRPTIFIN